MCGKRLKIPQVFEEGPPGRRGVADLLWLLVAVAVFVALHLSAAAQIRIEPRRVLILNDLGIISSPGFAEVDQALVAGLQKSRYHIDLYEESLEVTLFPDEGFRRRFREEFVRRYSERKPDVIIAAGSESLKFLTDLHEKFLRDTPIVVCVILEEIPERLRSEMQVTGVVARMRPDETLNVALRLLPRTKHVVVTGGKGKFDYRFEEIAKQSFRNYESKLDFTYLTDLNMPTLLERLRKLPSDTIVYHTAISEDAAGERFIDSAQALPLVIGAANAPVFVMDDVDFRGGAVGGHLVNWADDATAAAGMAVRILNGERAKDIPIVTSTNEYMFDWRALKRWGMKESDLPSGSIVLNRQFSVWDSYKQYILAGVCLILFQAFLIGGLLWQRARRRQAIRDLQKQTTEVKARKELLKIFVKNVPAGVAMLDRDMRYVQVSDRWCEDYGLDASTILGRSHYEVLTDAPDWWKQIHRRALDGETLRADEDRWERKSGTTWVRWEVRPWLSVDGTPGGILIFAEDITRRKQADDALSGMTHKLIESQEQERSRIGRELHDDINQRLALVAVELDRFKQNASANDFHDVLEKAKGRVIKIATDVQALSHQLHSSKLEYLGLAAAAKSCCREISEMHNVQVDFTHDGVPRNLPQEVALSLFRVLQEALQNAVKYSGTDHFEVELCGTDSDLTLKVRDFGPGFDVAEAMKTKGLGLVSMRERINLVKGELEIKSDSVSGTEITAQVPIPASDRTSNVTPISARKMKNNTRSQRIVLADDFPEIFEQAKKLLRNDYEIVGFASNGGEALRLCSTLNPDIVLLDISMPVLSGFEVATRLKELGCRSKIIFVTGQEDHDYIDSAFSLGALAYVLKARMGTDLLPAIDGALKGFTFTSPIAVQVAATSPERR